jgi:undecaprenyl-phosphate 4-deoxy-4-formamido-L-arabinose transferase
MRVSDAAVSVVVPVYNSQNTLQELARRLENILDKFKEYEIIFVDDASFDTSFEKIKVIASENGRVKGIMLKENSGQQSAILCGLRYAKYDYTVIIDDDLEQSPEDILRLYEKLIQGYDAVYGIVPGRGVRKAGSLMRDLLFCIMTDIPRRVKVSSFRIINKKTRDAVILADTRFVYISMEILKHTNNIANIAMEHGPKAQSNYSLGKLFTLYKNIIMTYVRCPLIRGKNKKGDCYTVRETIGDVK